MWHRIPRVHDRQCQRYIKSGREFISVLDTKACQDNINYSKNQTPVQGSQQLPFEDCFWEKYSVFQRFDYSDSMYSLAYLKINPIEEMENGAVRIILLKCIFIHFCFMGYWFRILFLKPSLIHLLLSSPSSVYFTVEFPVFPARCLNKPTMGNNGRKC